MRVGRRVAEVKTGWVLDFTLGIRGARAWGIARVFELDLVGVWREVVDLVSSEDDEVVVVSYTGCLEIDVLHINVYISDISLSQIGRLEICKLCPA